MFGNERTGTLVSRGDPRGASTPVGDRLRGDRREQGHSPRRFGAMAERGAEVALDAQ
jgi:hypothetical protein